MSAPSFYRARADEVCPQIKVVPRASRDRVGEVPGDRLRIKTATPPVDAAANETVLVDGPAVAEVLAALQAG